MLKLQVHGNMQNKYIAVLVKASIQSRALQLRSAAKSNAACGY